MFTEGGVTNLHKPYHTVRDSRSKAERRQARQSQQLFFQNPMLFQVDFSQHFLPKNDKSVQKVDAVNPKASYSKVSQPQPENEMPPRLQNIDLVV